MLKDAKLLEEDFDGGSRRSWGSTINVAGEVFATSLFWQPLQNKDDPFTEVGEAAEGILEGADLFCIKGGKAPQFGICVSAEGYKSGMLSAAVALASSLSDRPSSVAVFRVNEGWWYTCIRNDIILSDGDMLFSTEEEAKNQFMSMLAVPDWGRKIAPPEWEIEETEYPDIADLLGRGVRSKLQKIKGLRGTKLMAVVAISAVVGLWLISSIFEAIFLAPPKRPMIAPVAPKVIQPVEVPPEIKPWETLYNPAEVMNGCYKATIDLVKIMPPGWDIGDITCIPSGASTTWIRDVGRMTWINKALDMSGLHFSSRIMSDDGRSVFVSLPLPTIQKVSSPPQTYLIDLRAMLNDLFQAIGQDVVLENQIITSPEGNFYRKVNFKLISNHNPMVWLDLLIKFSALDITIIKHNPAAEYWEYEGAIYAL